MFSLSGVQQQQQQQQLQMLQLQQLFQQLQNHGQNIQGISLSQGTNRNQTTAIGAPAIMSAVMPSAGLQLNSVVDMTSLNPSLSPAAQGYQSQISPAAAAPLQHISPALAVHPVTPVNSCGTLNVVQSGGLQNLMQIPAKHLHPLQSQQLSSDQVIHTNHNPALNPPGTSSSSSAHESATPQVPQLVPDSLKSAATASPTAKPPQPSKPKPKSKSKKSENKKTADLEAERNEEDIAATVQQILAQAVQQQRELNLAAKNQPPPPPKSKNKKSHYQTKASQATKDHDLGRLASISDDVEKSEGVAVREMKLFGASKQHPVVLEPTRLSTMVGKSGYGEAWQSVVTSSPNLTTLTTRPVTITGNGLHPINVLDSDNHFIQHFVEQTLAETSHLANTSVNKSSATLKGQLSTVISKDCSQKCPLGSVARQFSTEAVQHTLVDSIGAPRLPNAQKKTKIMPAKVQGYLMSACCDM